MTAILRTLFGRSGGQRNVDIYNPTQTALLDDIVNRISGVLPGYIQGRDQDFETYAAPFRRSFQQQTLPALENRYANLLGSGSYEGSSGFINSLGTAAREFEEDLAARRIAMQNEDFQRISQLLNPAFMNRKYTYYEPRQSGLLEDLLVGGVSGYFRGRGAGGGGGGGGTER